MYRFPTPRSNSHPTPTTCQSQSLVVGLHAFVDAFLVVRMLSIVAMLQLKLLCLSMIPALQQFFAIWRLRVFSETRVVFRIHS
jgi:hypothetical protein